MLYKITVTNMEVTHMNAKKISIGLLFLVVSAMSLFAQGGNDNSHHRGGHGERHGRNSGRHQGQNGHGIVGEIQNITLSNESFEFKGDNNITITINTDENTSIVHADDIRDLFSDKDLRGRHNDLLDNIDTDGMSDAEIRQAMFDANEEQIAEMEKEVEAIAVDFSELEKGDDIRVQMSFEGENVARLIVIL